MSTAIDLRSGGSDSNAFAQQGTVDWTMLSRSTVNFTVEILSRLSKAGVEPITAAMGQAIFSGFNLDPEGQKRFSDVVSHLKAFSSYGEIMWFGFGVKHIVRTLSETEQGATCAAICACLSVSYDKYFCGKVLKALADQQKAPNSLMPSISQWVALANICSGAVLGSRFPQLVEVYSRLTQSYPRGIRHGLQETTSADALASALLELAKVSSGTVRSVTFIGGVDCGWLAALAQWLLSLRVDIITVDGINVGFGDNIETATIKDKLFRRPLVSTAIELFTGHPGINYNWAAGLSAGSESGVCAYLPSLQNPTTSPREQLRVIVVTGHIEWNSKIFSQVKDGKHERDEGPLGDLASSLIDDYGSSVTLKAIIGHGHGDNKQAIRAHANVRDLERVTIHSFLSGGPSSQVLLTSAKFLRETQTTQSPHEPDYKVSEAVEESNSDVLPSPMLHPTPQTAEPPSGLDHTISSDNRLSDSSALLSQAIFPPTSRLAQPPFELDHLTRDINQQKSDSSTVTNQAMQAGIPDRGRDFKSSNPSEIRRARSL
ncbi:hypothetical protein ACLOAV_007272 [Pseudogymnoascus australis]